MAKRSKRKSTAPVRSKLEELEKRRLLSTTLPLGAPTIVPDVGSLTELSQPAASGADNSTATSTAADTSATDTSDPSLDLSIGLDGGLDVRTDSLTDIPPAVAQLPIDPIVPIAFDDVGPQVDPVGTVIDLTTPIDPVQFVDPTPTTTGANSTDPTATVTTTIDTTVDTTIDPSTTVDPIATIVPATPVNTSIDATTDTTVDTNVVDLTLGDTTSTTATDATPVTDPLASVDPIATVTTTTGVTTTDVATTDTTSTDTSTITPVVVTVPIVDQTDLGDATPTTPVASTTPTDTSGSSTESNVTTAQTPVVSQTSQEQAGELDPPFMHVSLPPMIGGNHDAVSGMHPVYVPVDSTVQTVTSDVSSTARQSAPAASSVTETAQTQSHADVHENTVTGTVTVATQAAFSAMLIPPAAQEAPAPAPDADAIAAVVDRNIDVTGTRKDMSNQLAEEHLKLTRLVWTFPTIDNQPAVADASAAEPTAQTASGKVAPVSTADASTDGPALIQLVQEIDVSPAEAAAQIAAAQSGAQAKARVVNIPVVGASVTNALNDSAGRTRNIVLAVVAGVASLAVQSYRSSRRKLAAAARAAHLDPLAAWLDDPEFNSRG